MRYLMGDDIVDDWFGRKDEPPAKREITPAGTASPSALRIAYTYPRQLASDPRSEGTRPVSKLDARHCLEVVTDAALEMRGIAAHPDLSVMDRYRRSCRVVLALDAMGDAEQRHDDPLREPHRLRQGCEASGDPSLLGGEKPQPVARRHAGGQDQLDLAFGRIDPQRDSPRPLADPNRNASIGIVRRHRLPSGIFQCQRATQPNVSYQPSAAAGGREAHANGGLEARVLVCTNSTRGGPAAESASLGGFAVDEVDKRTEDGSLPQTMGAEMFVCCAEYRKERDGGA